MSDESRYCPECVRLQAELEDARTGHSYALLKLSGAYYRGRDDGYAAASVAIVIWLEDMAEAGHEQAALLQELAQRIMDGEPDKEDGPTEEDASKVIRIVLGGIDPP